MVSLLDFGLMEFILPVFIFILVYAIIFGVLQKIKVLGDSKNLNGWVAFALAALFAIMPGAMEFVTVIAPWFTILVILAFSFLLVFMFMGVTTEQIEKLATDNVVIWTVIIIGIFIIIGGLTAVYGPIIGGPAPGGESVGEEVRRSIFNIKVLTTVLILIIFAFAVRLLSFETRLGE